MRPHGSFVERVQDLAGVVQPFRRYRQAEVTGH